MSWTLSCPLCRSQGPHKVLYSGPQEQGRSVAFLRCPCRLIFRNPPPTRKELEGSFQKYWKGSEKERSSLKKSLGTAHQLLSQFEKYSKRKRLLDIGCGPGFYLMAARERGWETYGVDLISPRSFSEEGIRIFEGTLEEAHFPSEFFGACLISHTLNHLLGPVESLREVHRVLEHRGILCVVTPNFLRFGSLGLQWKWDTLVSVQYPYLFGEKTTRRLICQSGFEIFGFDARASLVTGNLLKRFHIFLESPFGRRIVRFAEKPKEFLRVFFGNILPGPTITIWARKVL